MGVVSKPFKCARGCPLENNLFLVALSARRREGRGGGECTDHKLN